MLYAIIAEDRENSLGKRMQQRPAHLQRLQLLLDTGKLILAGPHPAIDDKNPGDCGFTGSLIVAEFDSLAEAEKWARDDPYHQAGVYAHVKVKPFNKVFP